MVDIPLLQDARNRPAAANHVARLYRTDAELAGVVARFVADGLARGEAVLVIATATHWAQFVARLATIPEVDLVAAIVSGQLRIIDADLALSAVMTNDMPEWHRVEEAASRIVEGSCKKFGGLRVFGEMVNLLWQRQNRAAAEQLEMHWNAIAYKYPITRMCAYRVNDGDTVSGNDLLRCVCKTHSSVIPPGEPAKKRVAGSGLKTPPVREATSRYWP